MTKKYNAGKKHAKDNKAVNTNSQQVFELAQEDVVEFNDKAVTQADIDKLRVALKKQTKLSPWKKIWKFITFQKAA